MKRQFRAYLLAGWLAAPFAMAAADTPPAWTPIELNANDRLLILAPHPDDEVIACGGIVEKANAMKLPVRIAYFTFGDNNEWSFLLYRKHPVLLPGAVRAMGEVRHGEAVAAAGQLGLTPSDLTFLGYPDFGTFHIWCNHWDEQPPFESMLTKVTAVPYTNALSFGAPYKGESIVADLKKVISGFRPTRVFVSHPGDHNPDHRALYLFTRIALWELQAQIQPELDPYLVHVANWPAPRGIHTDQRLDPPAMFANQIRWRVNELSTNEVAAKMEALKKHQSQFAYAAAYLESFVRPNELFGDLPPVQLTTSTNETDLDQIGRMPEMPEELTDEERASFTGVERRTIRLEGDRLALALDFSRPFATAVEATADFFGFRPDRPFTEMPKVQVQIGPLGHKVYSQQKELKAESVVIQRNRKGFVIHIPLKLLGNPNVVLTSARTFLGDVPLDWVSWRIVNLPETVQAAEKGEAKK